VPCFVCWEIWKHRNAILFEENIVSLWRVVHSYVSSYGEFCKKDIAQKVRITRHPNLNVAGAM